MTGRFEQTEPPLIHAHDEEERPTSETKPGS